MSGGNSVAKCKQREANKDEYETQNEPPHRNLVYSPRQHMELCRDKAWDHDNYNCIGQEFGDCLSHAIGKPLALLPRVSKILCALCG
jgi:hypothetical protein